MFTPSPRRPGEPDPRPAPAPLDLPGPGASRKDVYRWLESQLSASAMRAVSDKDNPPHGQPGHVCAIQELTGLSVPEIVDLIADNTPIQWLIMSAKDRAESVSQFRDDFLSVVRRAAVRADVMSSDDADIPREVIVLAVLRQAQIAGKPCKLILDTLGLSLDDFPPAMVAEWDAMRADYFARLKEAMPDGVKGVFPETPDDALFNELAKDLVPEGKVLQDGILVPAELAERVDREREEIRSGADWSADNPLEKSLGKCPFVLVEFEDVGIEGLGRLNLYMGGGAEMVSKALSLLDAARREIIKNAGRCEHHEDE